MEQDILLIESVQERDIDLLLLEEFSVDISYCEWFTKELNLPKLNIVNGAWRSISSDGLGETDILFSYSSSGQKIFVLIENKLDAPFQPKQFERYEIRANRFISRGDCSKSFCVLIAPEKYCNIQTKFKSISYENIKKWFESQNTKRGKFKQKLLQLAIEKQRRGRTLSEFCSDYWKFFDAHKTMELYYDRPKKSKASNQAQFYPKILPKFNVYHLFEKGIISISIERKYLKESEVKFFLSFEELNPKETKRKIGFRFEVPKINSSQQIKNKKLNNIFSIIDKKVNLIKTKTGYNNV